MHLVPTPRIDSADLLGTTRRMVDDTRVLIDRLRSHDDTNEILCIIGTVQRQLRQSQLCLLRVNRVLNANPGLFAVCEYRGERPEVDATYRRFMEGLRVACDRSSDDGN
jgi:hypothetical protein